MVITTVFDLLAVIGIVFAINLLPAFGPPTWALLVFARFRWHDIPPAALIAVGALAATAGRLILAVGTDVHGGRSGRHTPAATCRRVPDLPRSVAAVVLMIRIDWIKVID